MRRTLRHVTSGMVLLTLSLAGCASAPYGNFSGAPAKYDEQMATETAKQLLALYRPASTRINLMQAVARDDAYGTALIKLLHDHGYAVEERAGEGKTDDGQAVTPSVGLSYIVDQVNQIHYRVTVFVGNQTISRMFQANNGGFNAIGLWTRKEQ